MPVGTAIILFLELPLGFRSNLPAFQGTAPRASPMSCAISFGNTFPFSSPHAGAASSRPAAPGAPLGCGQRRRARRRSRREAANEVSNDCDPLRGRRPQRSASLPSHRGTRQRPSRSESVGSGSSRSTRVSRAGGLNAARRVFVRRGSIPTTIILADDSALTLRVQLSQAEAPVGEACGLDPRCHEVVDVVTLKPPRPASRDAGASLRQS